MKLEFREEMLMPQINGEIYYSVYELENWLRRICLTAYMIEYGADWANHIPKKIKDGSVHRMSKSQELIYLDADSEENIIWSLTQGELAQMLFNPNVWGRIQHLTGFNQDRFSHKLNELREIRNLSAHNRALSERTSTIAKGIIESLHLLIDRFKSNFLYSNEVEVIEYDFNDEVCIYFSNKMEENNWSNFQTFIEGDESLYSLVCLSVERDYRYPSAYKILDKFNKVMENILAIQLNKTGDEFTILIPKKIAPNKCFEIIDIFLEKDNLFTHKEFEEQHPKYICNPKIWFYENKRIINE